MHKVIEFQMEVHQRYLDYTQTIGDASYLSKVHESNS